MESKISVIIPVYNSSNYLKRCIESVLSQTLKELEIVIVDDGSFDGSEKLCDEFAEKDKRVKVLHQKNSGQTVARRNGLKLANSKYVCYVDSDDWIEAGYYEKLLDIAVRYDTDMVLCDHYIDDECVSRHFANAIKEGFYSGSDIKSEVSHHVIGTDHFFKWNIYPSLCNRLFKKDKIIEIQRKVDSSIVMGEDAAVSIPYTLQCDSMVVLRDAYYHYYQHFDSTIRSIQSRNDIIQYKKLYALLKESLCGYCDEKIVEKQLEDYLLFIAGPRVMRLAEKYNEFDELFPFDGVKKGSNVVIYGAGVFGLNMYRYFNETGFCRNDVMVDREYKIFINTDYKVISPEAFRDIPNEEYDFVIVTVMDENARISINKYLREIGIASNKIKMVVMSKFRKWISNEIMR